MRTLGLRSLVALGVAWGLSTAPIWAQEASPENPLDAAIDLLDQGLIHNPEFESLLAEIRRQAEAGDPYSMNFIGVLRRDGLILEGPSAEDWYRRALATANPDASPIAAFNLYGVLLSDEDVTRRRGARSLLESIEQAPAGLEAQINGFLGADYFFGLSGDAKLEQGQVLLDGAITEGFDIPWVLLAYEPHISEVDPARGRAMLRAAADQGHPHGAWRYAMALLQIGDESGAYRYVAQASDQGYLQAHLSRAVMLALGQGVDVDATAARSWYMTAVSQGSAHGARGLAGMLITGEGGPANPALGYGLLELARDAGDEHAFSLFPIFRQNGFEPPSRAEIDAALDRFLADTELSRDDFR